MNRTFTYQELNQSIYHCNDEKSCSIRIKVNIPKYEMYRRKIDNWYGLINGNIYYTVGISKLCYKVYNNDRNEHIWIYLDWCDVVKEFPEDLFEV